MCWEMVVSVMARNKSSHEYVCNDELLPRKGGVKGRRETRLNLQIQKKSIVNANKGREITYSRFDFNFQCMFK